MEANYSLIGLKLKCKALVFSPRLQSVLNSAARLLTKSKRQHYITLSFATAYQLFYPAISADFKLVPRFYLCYKFTVRPKEPSCWVVPLIRALNCSLTKELTFANSPFIYIQITLQTYIYRKLIKVFYLLITSLWTYLFPCLFILLVIPFTLFSIYVLFILTASLHFLILIYINEFLKAL